MPQHVIQRLVCRGASVENERARAIFFDSEGPDESPFRSPHVSQWLKSSLRPPAST